MVCRALIRAPWPGAFRRLAMKVTSRLPRRPSGRGASICSYSQLTEHLTGIQVAAHLHQALIQQGHGVA